ncbi:MAG: cytochrome c biogenesis protein CcdA, partial [Armatimonadota bacterium]
SAAFLGGALQIVTIESAARNKTIAPGETTRVAFRLKVLKNYHIQSNKPTDPALIPTELAVKAPAGIIVSDISYPAPRMESFEFAQGKKYAVFADGAVIVADVAASKSANPGLLDIRATLSYQGCNQQQCYPPQEATAAVRIGIGTKSSPPENDDYFTASASLKENEQQSPVTDAVRRYGFAGVFGFAYLAGLLLSLTPCVFPLIPITLGYFRGQASDSRSQTVKLALAYVAGLCTTYSVLGLAAATTGSLFGAWLSNPLVLAFFALIVAAMALSMFGFYELKAPAFLAGKSGAKAGLGGAFVMGLLFGVVAAPCTGPATIALLTFVGQLAKPVLGFSIFFVLGLGITTPLLALAVFSGNLPRSGAWMDWVKHFMGAMMLGAAVYFLKPLIGSQITNWTLGATAAGFGVWLAVFEKSGWKPKSLAIARIGVGVALLALGISMFVPKGPGIVWQQYSPAKVTQAQADKKPVVIDFWATWCAACMELKEGAFRDKNAVRESEEFVRLHVDATDSKKPEVQAALARFKVIGLPTVIFINANGVETGERLLGNVSGKEFAQRLHEARGKRLVPQD